MYLGQTLVRYKLHSVIKQLILWYQQINSIIILAVKPINSTKGIA